MLLFWFTLCVLGFVFAISTYNVALERIYNFIARKRQEKLIPKSGELYEILTEVGIVGWCPNEQNTKLLFSKTTITIIESNVDKNKLPPGLKEDTYPYHSAFVNDQIYLIGQYYFSLEHLKRIIL